MYSAFKLILNYNKINNNFVLSNINAFPFSNIVSTCRNIISAFYDADVNRFAFRKKAMLSSYFAMQISLHLHSQQRHIYFSKMRKRITFLRDIIFIFLDKEIKI